MWKRRWKPSGKNLCSMIDLRTGWKIDLIICKSRPFSQEEFSRRKLIQV